MSPYNLTLKIKSYKNTEFVSRIIPHPNIPGHSKEAIVPAAQDKDYREMLQKTITAAEIFAAGQTNGDKNK